MTTTDRVPALVLRRFPGWTCQDSLPPLPIVRPPTADDDRAMLFLRMERELIVPALRAATAAEFDVAFLTSIEQFLLKAIAITQITPVSHEDPGDALERMAMDYGGEEWAESMRFGYLSILHCQAAHDRLRLRGFPRTDPEILAFVQHTWGVAGWCWALACFGALARHRVLPTPDVQERVRRLLEDGPELAWVSLRTLELEAVGDQGDQAALPFETSYDEEAAELLEDADWESERLLRAYEAG